MIETSCFNLAPQLSTGLADIDRAGTYIFTYLWSRKLCSQPLLLSSHSGKRSEKFQKSILERLEWDAMLYQDNLNKLPVTLPGSILFYPVHPAYHSQADILKTSLSLLNHLKKNRPWTLISYHSMLTCSSLTSAFCINNVATTYVPLF